MAIAIQNQNFGVEIELTGITRSHAARIIAMYYGTNSSHVGTCYDTYTATDRKGRTWKAMSDSSIVATKKENDVQVSADSSYKCEIVTPILQYDDIEDLQEIVRKLVKGGAVANSSCGIHVHVDGANHTPQSLTRLMNFAIGRQDLFYEALQIGDRANRWCHKISRDLLRTMKKLHTAWKRFGIAKQMMAITAALIISITIQPVITVSTFMLSLPKEQLNSVFSTVQHTQEKSKRISNFAWL